MKIFVFHDADPFGYMIADKIGDSSGAHNFDFEIIDAGLRLEEALELGLSTETFSRKKALPKKLNLTPVERQYFNGSAKSVVGRNGKRKTHWVDCQRVELNALAVDPPAFVEWVEAKLQQHGAARKLVPDDSELKNTARTKFRLDRRNEIEAALLRHLDIAAIVRRIEDRLPMPDFNDVPARIHDWATTPKPQSWTSECAGIAADEIEMQLDAIAQAIKEVPQ